eukprot:UN2525
MLPPDTCAPRGQRALHLFLEDRGLQAHLVQGLGTRHDLSSLQQSLHHPLCGPVQRALCRIVHRAPNCNHSAVAEFAHSAGLESLDLLQLEALRQAGGHHALVHHLHLDRIRARQRAYPLHLHILLEVNESVKPAADAQLLFPDASLSDSQGP